MRALLAIAPLVVFVACGSPDFDLLNIVPDRTVSKFSVDLTLYCGSKKASRPFECTVQLREWNAFVDEAISRKTTVTQKGNGTVELQLKGQMYQIQEPGDAFEPYLRLSCYCGKEKGDLSKNTEYYSGDIHLEECSKADKVCFDDQIIDILKLT